MKEFYDKYDIKEGDELIIQFVDDEKFKIIPEKIFTAQVKQLEQNLEKSLTEDESSVILEKISRVVNRKPSEVIMAEYSRMANKTILERKTFIKTQIGVKEGVPPSLRKILSEVYKGRCQVTQFTFQKKNGGPYFELHHINSQIGNHLKNILVVSPNVHAQFTHANVIEKFDEENWLREVEFNGEKHSVNQAIDKYKVEYFKEIHE